jgi:hypothetical protein
MENTKNIPTGSLRVASVEPVIISSATHNQNQIKTKKLTLTVTTNY